MARGKTGITFKVNTSGLMPVRQRISSAAFRAVGSTAKHIIRVLKYDMMEDNKTGSEEPVYKRGHWYMDHTAANPLRRPPETPAVLTGELINSFSVLPGSMMSSIYETEFGTDLAYAMSLWKGRKALSESAYGWLVETDTVVEGKVVRKKTRYSMGPYPFLYSIYVKDSLQFHNYLLKRFVRFLGTRTGDSDSGVVE